MIAIQTIIFYAFAALLIFSAVMVVVSPNPVRAALFLVLAFFASAGLWLLMEAEFLALVLILVYVGAVMTLFLFVVMTLNIKATLSRAQLLRYLPLGAIVAALMVGLLMNVLNPTHFDATRYASAVSHAADYSNTHALGSVLYTQYVYPFELAGILLLVAIVAAISLSSHVERQRKMQEPSEQMNVQARDRLRIVKMASEKRLRP